MRAAFAVGLCAVGLLGFWRHAGAEARDRALAPRLSSAEAATEYWDVTTWFASGERVIARFLVTNQGPGTRTAAAAGHVVLPSGALLPFQWGRLREQWTLGPNGRSLKIAKATLDLAGPTIVFGVDSAKHGVEIRLEIDRGRLATIADLDPGYVVEVALPARARGRIGDHNVVGTGVVTHTILERFEKDLIRRRLELFATAGDLGLYLLDLTGVDGERRSRMLVARGTELVAPDDFALELATGAAPSSTKSCPLPDDWSAKTAALAVHVTVGRELLRMNPLDVLPQPFRFLLGLGGKPQRVWADAAADLELTPAAGTAVPHTTVRGIATATFAAAE